MGKFSAGSIFSTRRSGDVEVVEYRKSVDITVRFLKTGNEYVTTAGHLIDGRLSDRLFNDKIKAYRKGLTLNSKDSGKFLITENIDETRVKVIFIDTGTEIETDAESVLSGNVKDPNTPPSFDDNKRFCVYLHKTSDGIIRYVGEGTIQRAYSKTRPDQPLWESIFRGKDFIVDVVKSELSKRDAENLEKQLREEYSATIINNKFATKTPHKISYNFISKFVYYDPSSPTYLRWLSSLQNDSLKGLPAGHIKKDGYVSVEIAGVCFAAHRIIYTLFYGEFDDLLVVDHIDGDKHNNCISNLRLVTHSKNSLNKVSSAPPKSGFRNISSDGYGYHVRWHENGVRNRKYFSFNDFESTEHCLMAAYLFRDDLIVKGFIPERIKEGEVKYFV